MGNPNTFTSRTYQRKDSLPLIIGNKLIQEKETAAQIAQAIQNDNLENVIQDILMENNVEWINYYVNERKILNKLRKKLTLDKSVLNFIKKIIALSIFSTSMTIFTKLITPLILKNFMEEGDIYAYCTIMSMIIGSCVLIMIQYDRRFKKLVNESCFQPAMMQYELLKSVEANDEDEVIKCIEELNEFYNNQNIPDQLKSIDQDAKFFAIDRLILIQKISLLIYSLLLIASVFEKEIQSLNLFGN